MKRFAPPVLLAAALFWSAALQAAILTFSTTLSGAGENPDVTTTGTGTAQVVIDTIAHTMAVHVEFADLIGTTVDAHIHCCTGPTTNVGVAVGFMPAGFPLGVTSGVFDHTFDLTAAIYTTGFINNFAGGNPAAAEAALINNMLNGLAYVNIHTSFVGSGEIRGQLVPEPATVLLLGIAALAALGLRHRA